jgi:hypothetical protein
MELTGLIVAAEKALYDILSSAAGVTQYVGGRIYPSLIDQGAGLPAIAYEQISGPRFHEVSHPMGWVESRYQISIWAATYLQACEISDAVRIAIDGYTGVTVGLDIDHIFVTDEGDLSSLFAENAALDMHGKRIDALIVFRE